MKKLTFISCLYSLFCVSLCLNAQTNTFPSSGNVGIGTTSPNEKLQIGNTFTFHDSGHKVLGILYSPSGGVDLDNTKYAAEIRFDPSLGNLRLGTSSSITNNPSTRMTIDNSGNIGIGTSNPTRKIEIGDG